MGPFARFKRWVIGRDNGPLLDHAETVRTRTEHESRSLVRGLRRIQRVSNDPLSDIITKMRERHHARH